MLCDYGCGNDAKFTLKNGKVCCSHSHNSCLAVRKRRSDSLKGTRVGEENPFYGKKHSEDFKRMRKEKMIGSNNPCYRKKYTKYEREQMSIAVKTTWNDEELLRKAKERGIRNFQSENYLNKFIKGCTAKPNRHEKFLNKYLKFLNLDFLYVGNYKKWIGGKNPDFIMGTLLIEYFGTYWHDVKDEEERINHFKNYGYETLVIWEEELNKLILLKNKIYQFIIERECL